VSDTSGAASAEAEGAESAKLIVDIVISNHDYADYLQDAIDSACSQSHQNVNVIVVDDGSTDRSRELLRRNRGPACVVEKENGGQASALNAGLERCRGDVVIFLDSDDILRTDIAAKLCAVFARDPSVVKVQFRMEVIDAHGLPIGLTKPPPYLHPPSGDLRRAELAYPFDLTWMPTSGNGFRLDALRRILPIPEHDYPRYGADWYLVHLATLLGNVVSLEDVGASYRVHGRNNYELQSARLDLNHLRDAITFASVTTRSLELLADDLGLERPRRILSVSYLGNRLLSWKLDRHNHPIADDGRRRLLMDAVRATTRRSDVNWTTKLRFVGWFVATTYATRTSAHRLGEIYLFPQLRPTFAKAIRRVGARRSDP
jgi:glycosyltransferase involved in cell wall biosynthesis